MPVPSRLSIARPKGAAIRGLDIRAVIVGPSLGAMTVVTDHASDSSRRGFREVGLADRFMQLCQLQRVLSFVSGVLLQGSLREVQVPLLLLTAGVLLRAAHHLVVLIVVHLVTGPEIALERQCL